MLLILPSLLPGVGPKMAHTCRRHAGSILMKGVGDQYYGPVGALIAGYLMLRRRDA